MSRFLGLPFIVFCLVVSLTGSAVVSQSHAQNSVRIGLQALPAGLGSPFGSFNIPGAVPLDAIFDALTAIDETGATVPALATRWRAETPTSWAFDLRDDVQFSNGERFNANSVVAAIEVLRTDASATSLGTTIQRLGILSAEARGPFTVVFTLAKPDALFAQYMSALRIPAPQALRDAGLDDFAKQPVGTGPFAVADWSDNRVDMESFDESWRTPKLDGMTIIQLSDGAARRQGLLSGSLDIAFWLSPDDKEEVEAVGGRMWVRPEPGTNFLAFLTVKDSPLKDVRVRQALNYAVNKQRIIDAFLGGAVAPASQIAHSMSFGYNADLSPYPYDPEQARKLLADAGYGDGFDVPTLLVPGGSANSQDWYQQIATDLAQVGVRMEIRATTLSRYLEYMYNGGWPSLAFAMSAYTFDPVAAYRIRSCAWTHPYHCDPTIMPLIDHARAADAPEERRLRTFDVMRHEHENPPGIFLWQSVSFEGLGPLIYHYWSGADTVAVEDITVTQ